MVVHDGRQVGPAMCSRLPAAVVRENWDTVVTPSSEKMSHELFAKLRKRRDVGKSNEAFYERVGAAPEGDGQ